MLKKIIVVMAFVVIATLAYDYYKRNLDRDRLNSIREYWSTALEQATEDDLSVREFMKKHSDRTEFISTNGHSVLLRETILVKGLVCSEWSIDIYYTSKRQGAGRLWRVTDTFVCL